MNTTCPVLTDALLDRLRALSASFCLAEGGSHGPDHSERVLQTALTLGRRMGARLEILAPAALLHDIGRREESQSRGRICHAERGAELAAPLLPELGYSVAEVAPDACNFSPFPSPLSSPATLLVASSAKSFLHPPALVPFG